MMGEYPSGLNQFQKTFSTTVMAYRHFERNRKSAQVKERMKAKDLGGFKKAVAKRIRKRREKEKLEVFEKYGYL